MNNMIKKILLSLLSLIIVAGAYAQPRYIWGKMKHETLNRGLVAIRQSTGDVAVSWRSLRADNSKCGFDLYRNGIKINKKKITGATFFTDTIHVNGDVEYSVKGGSVDGKYLLKANAPNDYISIKINKPEGGITPDGQKYDYTANDASIGDVDGDGQYEIILKWDPTNSHDNSQPGYTGNTYLDCYTLEGKQLWRIDLGKNIRSGAHYTPFMVYDFDGDGKAEVMMRTCDGTIDGLGNVIGDANADWREIAENKWRGIIKHGNEYLTVFDGLTGKALSTVNYVPSRGKVDDWGDDHANRSERYLAGVGYLDGVHASAIFIRGYYTRTVVAAWDWDGKELKQHWVFDTNNPKWKDYGGNGNHNIRVADVDGDGCDEITLGSVAIDNDGSGLYNTHMGHGDAIHLTAFYPGSDKLQVWDCHENRRDGSDFRDAATGKVKFQIPSNEDVGRCMAADIDPTNPGLEMWSADSKGLRNVKGDILNGRVRSTNFGIWWDGDLLRELLDHERVLKYDWKAGRTYTLLQLKNCKFNNGTKSNPCLSADILGDWREEILTRDETSSELRLYVSTIPTTHRMTCLEEDVPYRLGVAAENSGYNQPPETGFYFGAESKF